MCSFLYNGLRQKIIKKYFGSKTSALIEEVQNYIKNYPSYYILLSNVWIRSSFILGSREMSEQFGLNSVYSYGKRVQNDFRTFLFSFIKWKFWYIKIWFRFYSGSTEMSEQIGFNFRVFLRQKTIKFLSNFLILVC
jgi:hypothetical protein